MRLTKTRKRIRLAFVLIAFACALSGEGTVTVYQAKASPEAQILPVSDKKKELVSGTQDGKSDAPVGVYGLPSEEQKTIVREVAKKIYDNRKSLIEKHGVSENLFIETAYYDILAMTFRESSFDCSRTGDWKNGLPRSYGCLQIQTKMHNVTIKQAEDYRFSVEWTLDRMVRDGAYPKMRTAAIAKHNGSGNSAENYAEAVKKVADYYSKIKLFAGI